MSADPPLLDAPAAASSEPERDATIDPARLRRFSLRARLIAVAVLAALVAAAAGVVALTAVADAADGAERVDHLAVASQRNSASADAIDAVGDAARADPPRSEAELDGLAQASRLATGRIGDALGPPDLGIDSEVVAADAAALQAALQLAAARSEAGGAALPATLERAEADAAAAAATAHRRFAAELDRRRIAARNDVRSARTRAVRLAVAVLVVGGGLLAVAAVAVTRSVTAPLRELGRAMRRFGDGDLRSRGVEAPDEVGTLARSFNATAGEVAVRVRTLRDDAERGTRLRIIAEALDLAHDEGDVHRVVEHAMGIVAPGRPVELLVNGAESSALRQVAVNPNGGPPNCPVDETMSCVAIRRARTMTWESPDQINACPFLRDRPSGPRSAVCVPINASGSLVGVLHSTGAVGEPPPPPVVEQLVVLGGQAGARIGSMRTLESSRVEASTDGLTGVANRRMLAATLADLLRTSTPFVLVVADLDRFKSLNDQYGHEVGDRALQLFAEVLQSNVRGRDLVARYGGEEFVLVYPEMNVKLSMEVLERIRGALAAALRTANLPTFTASYGVTHSSVASDPEGIIRAADAGLLMAKDLGRDRVVYADADLAAEMFGARPRPVAEPVPDEPPAADAVDVREAPDGPAADGADVESAAG